MTGSTAAAGERARHLYVHVPFCAHRCGYCDFVTAVGRHDEHAAYVGALLHELELRRDLLADTLETVYLGGGTPTYLEQGALVRLLAALPAAAELTVEANPETVAPDLARLLVEHGVDRVSLGAQSFQADLLSTLERQATPQAVREAARTLRAAGLGNLSLDLIYGIPGQSAGDLEADLEALVELAPEHVSAYELEAKPGTRFTLAHGRALEQQSASMEHYMQLVTETLGRHGYRWYETANFCRKTPGEERDLRSRHNLGYWLGHDYVGLGIGAVSTVGESRWENAPTLAGYLAAAKASSLPPSRHESLSPALRAWERAMLGLRLDEGVSEEAVAPTLDRDGLERMIEAGLAEHASGAVRLTPRGRLLGDAVTVELLAELPADGVAQARELAPAS